MGNGKRPSFQFYIRDWKTDSALLACSDLARLLLLELMILMHDGNPYGYLTLPNGTKIEPKMIQNLIIFEQKNVKKIPKLFQELVKNGVIKSDKKTGIFYNSRMVKDGHVTRVRAQSGKKGGNPNLLNQKVNQKNEICLNNCITPSTATATAKTKLEEVVNSFTTTTTPLPPTEQNENFDFTAGESCDNLKATATPPKPLPTQGGHFFNITHFGESYSEKDWLRKQTVEMLQAQGKKIIDSSLELHDLQVLYTGVKKVHQRWLLKPIEERMAALSYTKLYSNATNELTYAINVMEKRYDKYLEILQQTTESVRINDLEVDIDEN